MLSPDDMSAMPPQLALATSVGAAAVAAMVVFGGLAVILILLDCILFLLVGIHAECLLEGERIYLFQDGFESDQRFLEDLVPMFVCELGDHGY